MGTLEFKDYGILAADLGPENYMPDLGKKMIGDMYGLSDRVPEEDKEYIGKGMVRTILPYTLQDNYNRDRKMRNFRAAVLENDKLRAVFLPELGGRLWSLYHKEQQRELLYVNPVFQPANLALRNAWFSGGVEWNIGVRGHNFMTCAPLYACRMENQTGEPVLRMYEYERIRGVSYTMDFCLPQGSEILYARITVENTAPRDTYMYWWSNIAVPETEDTRVIVPAWQALSNDYREDGTVLDCVDIPFREAGGPDCSYPKNGPCANDYFFRIAKDRRKWITAVEKDGSGLLQFSTHELMGRKLFLWGQGQGGKNWSRWLAGEPAPYIEIQAGLARSQFEHFPMKAQSKITWVEGYTAADFTPSRVFGDFDAAVEAVEERVAALMGEEEAMHAPFAGLKPVSVEQQGTAWGYVENCLRKAMGEEPVSGLVQFPQAAVGQEEQLWLDFLETGVMEGRSLDTPPASFQADERWLGLFEKQIQAGKANAYMYLQYGITLYANGKTEEAHQAFRRSNALEPNAWACRNLAVVELESCQNPDKAAAYMEQAIGLNRSYRGLMVSCGQVMLGAEKYERWLEIFDSLEEGLQKDGRLQLYKALALVALERYAQAAQVINKDYMLCDIQEGEASISQIWEQIYTKLVQAETGISDAGELKALTAQKYPLPPQLDFQMNQ